MLDRLRQPDAPDQGPHSLQRYPCSVLPPSQTQGLKHGLLPQRRLNGLRQR